MFRRSTNLFYADGISFVRNRFTNKATAFTDKERDALKIRGVLPPAVETLTDQVARYWQQMCLLTNPINKYQLLRGVFDFNVTLFYAIIIKHLRACLPIIYTPTVGEACQKYGALYQRDHGFYFSYDDVGKVKGLLENIRRWRIEIIVITDGSRILGLGDLGANGMGISVGKSSLYVAGAGIQPSRVLPVLFDVGTKNEKFRNDPVYLGHRSPRVSDEVFYKLLDEFMEAVKETYPMAVVQFEDFSSNHCFDMLARYQKKYRCFNDDIQGTGAVVSAGFQNAVRLSGLKATEQRILVFGAGSAAAGVTESIAKLCAKKEGVSPADILKNVYMVDSKGLVAKNRGDKLATHKLPFAREDVPDDMIGSLKKIEDVVKYAKPTALVGLGGIGPVFTEEVVKTVLTNAERPIIFPLSNPTSQAEITAENAYKWTDGSAIVASGSPFPNTVVNGKICVPSQGNNLYVFPGIGLGAALAAPKYISDDVMVEASSCLSDLITDETMKATGELYPPLEEIRHVSAHIAVAVIQLMQKEGTATAELPDNYPDLLKLVENSMYQPVYPPTEFYLEGGHHDEQDHHGL